MVVTQGGPIMGWSTGRVSQRLIMLINISLFCFSGSDNAEGGSSCEGKSSSISDLQIPGSKVKRHGSLVNSLSSKAMRVKSRITDSFFKKGTAVKLMCNEKFVQFHCVVFKRLAKESFAVYFGFPVFKDI